jgi:hypothetical protein
MGEQSFQQPKVKISFSVKEIVLKIKIDSLTFLNKTEFTCFGLGSFGI